MILQSPTGSGKTVMIADMIKKARGRGLTAWLLCHRKELLEQLSGSLRFAGVGHGWIAAGRKPDPAKLVQVASVQSLVRRLEKIRSWPDFVAIDECHHSTAPTYQKILDAIYARKDPWVVGLTATPSRLSLIHI